MLWRIVILLACLAMSAACTYVVQTPASPLPAPLATLDAPTALPALAVPTLSPAAVTVPFSTVAQEAVLGDKPGAPVYAIVTNAGQWNALQLQLPAQALAAGRQFNPPSDNIYIIAFAGAKASSGYRISIQKIAQESARLTIVVSETAPRPVDIVEPAKTLPYHVVAVARSSLQPVARVLAVFSNPEGTVLSQQEIPFQ